MHYEHLIQITDPEDPAIAPLTRAQLWRGLVRRAEDPGEFVPGLDAMRVRGQGEDYIERELYFGKHLVSDRVSFQKQQAVHYAVNPGPDFPASRLSMHIEEPRPGHLFVRFRYESAHPESTGYEDFIRQAWYEADLDTVSRIRVLAQQGALD